MEHGVKMHKLTPLMVTRHTRCLFKSTATIFLNHDSKMTNPTIQLRKQLSSNSLLTAAQPT